MNWIKNMFGSNKEGETETQPDDTLEETGQFFFFVFNGNMTVADTYGVMFRKAAAGDAETKMILEPPARYVAYRNTLLARAGEAGRMSLGFNGQCIMDSGTSPAPKMGKVLQDIAEATSDVIHLAYISVNESGEPWAQKVHAALLKYFLSDGIPAYGMYVTKNKAAAQFVLDAFERVS